jgi:hypothetical protein
MSREFVGQLEAKERRFLLRLTRTLLEQGGMVHDVLQTFARSLKLSPKIHQTLLDRLRESWAS